jgi:hypothetical protein
MRFSIAAALGAATLVTVITSSRAHEGHDHGPQPAVQANAAPRGEAASAAFEVVVIAQGQELLIYLDRFATNEPVHDASIEVETPGGPASAVASNGAYRLDAPWLAKAGHVDLIVSVTSGADTDVLPVSIDIPDRVGATPEPPGYLARALIEPATGLAIGFGFLCGIVVMSFRRRGAAALIALAALLPHGEAGAHETAPPSVMAAAGPDRASRGADGAVFVPKPIQRIFGLRTVVTEAASHQRAIELPGRVIPDPTASGLVQTAIGGRLAPPPGGFPRLGSAVRQGDLLAYVTPPIQAIDVSDMRQRQGELDQQITIVERRLHRYERLAPSGAVAQIQLEETKLELEGLRDRRAALDKSRREPEALVAPVDGVIAEGAPVAGQIAPPNGVVFQIVDPARLWVEALSFATLPQPRSAYAMMTNGRSLALAFRGAGHAERNQSIPVQFQIEGDTTEVRAGLFLTVFLRSDEEKKGIAVPRASVIRAPNGQDVVYLHIGAERFEAHPVRVEPLDGDRVLVAAGLDAGARVVAQGAELLDHVR